MKLVDIMYRMPLTLDRCKKPNPMRGRKPETEDRAHNHRHKIDPYGGAMEGEDVRTLHVLTCQYKTNIMIELLHMFHLFKIYIMWQQWHNQVVSV